MLIVDSQVHICAADTPARPWPPRGAQRAQKPYPVTKDMLLAEMDTAGVSRVVIVPPSWEGDRNDLASGMPSLSAEHYPFRDLYPSGSVGRNLSSVPNYCASLSSPRPPSGRMRFPLSPREIGKGSL